MRKPNEKRFRRDGGNFCRLVDIVFVIFVFFFSTLAPANSDARLDSAIRVVVTLCLSGGTMTVSRSRVDTGGGEFHLESDKGSFTVESREVNGFVNGLDTALSKISADQADRARECMRPYISQLLAIAIGSPGGGPPVKPNELMNGISVVYYLKTADGSRVTDALKRRGISFTQLSSVLPDTLRTNAIYCGQDTPVAAIKELALMLIDNGIIVQDIERIQSNARNILYLLARASMKHDDLKSPPLSRAQIDQITGCPESPHKFIANFTHFKSPRPTARSDDNRYVDAWFNQAQTMGATEAAGLFCRQHGFADSTWWDAEQVSGVVALHLGDNSICQGTCYVFSSIYCG